MNRLTCFFSYLEKKMVLWINTEYVALLDEYHWFLFVLRNHINTILTATMLHDMKNGWILECGAWRKGNETYSAASICDFGRETK
jgi:hypothetical protein